MPHTMQNDLEIANMTGTGKALKSPLGYMLGWGSGAPGASTTGFAVGGQYLDTASGLWYQNIGTSAVPSFTLEAAKGSSVSIPVDAATVTSFVWVNNTGAPVTLTGVSFISAVQAASQTLDVRKIAVGVNPATGGVSLLLAATPIIVSTTSGTLINQTLTATLADRIVAPNEKISIVPSGTMTSLAGAVLTLLF